MDFAQAVPFFANKSNFAWEVPKPQTKTILRESLEGRGHPQDFL